MGIIAELLPKGYGKKSAKNTLIKGFLPPRGIFCHRKGIFCQRVGKVIFADFGLFWLLWGILGEYEGIFIGYRLVADVFLSHPASFEGSDLLPFLPYIYVCI